MIRVQQIIISYLSALLLSTGILFITTDVSAQTCCPSCCLCEQPRAYCTPECHPTWGYHQTCWRQFPPLQPCCGWGDYCPSCPSSGQVPTDGTCPGCQPPVAGPTTSPDQWNGAAINGLPERMNAIPVMPAEPMPNGPVYATPQYQGGIPMQTPGTPMPHSGFIPQNNGPANAVPLTPQPDAQFTLPQSNGMQPLDQGSSTPPAVPQNSNGGNGLNHPVSYGQTAGQYPQHPQQLQQYQQQNMMTGQPQAWPQMMSASAYQQQQPASPGPVTIQPASWSQRMRARLSALVRPSRVPSDVRTRAELPATFPGEPKPSLWSKMTSLWR